MKLLSEREGVHGGSDLARHHGSGEQLVQLDQLVGRRVELERDAVERVPRFHLEHKREERSRNQSPAPKSTGLVICGAETRVQNKKKPSIAAFIRRQEKDSFASMSDRIHISSHF